MTGRKDIEVTPMMKRREISLYYCNSCKSTTRHAESGNTSTCLRCGTVKTITRIKNEARNEERNPAAEMDWN